MRDKDTGQREVLDQNISILIDICTIISYRNKHKHLLDQPQHQHNSYCKIIIYLSLQNTQSPFPASPSCIICLSFCSWKSAHRQFAGYFFLIQSFFLSHQCENNGDPMSLKIVQCELGIKRPGGSQEGPSLDHFQMFPSNLSWFLEVSWDKEILGQEIGLPVQWRSLMY